MQDHQPQQVAYNQPSMVGNETEYMAQAIAAARFSGDGLFTLKASELLEQQLGVPKVLLTTSGTHALEMCALLLDIQPDDEVILPSFCFVSTVNAFVLRGARPVFADIRPDTLNLDESKLEGLITPQTRAIVAVHYAGVGCEMDGILETAGRRHIAVVEDNSQGLFGKYRGRYLGTSGVLAAQSFHESMNFTCGEGGALLINDPALAERAEVIRERGTNRSRFLRGQVDKYSWVDVGSSYMPADILAAFLLAQLEQREKVQKHRRKVWEFYQANLQDWARDHAVSLPYIPPYCEQSYHMFYLLLPTPDLRQGLIAHLGQRGIQSAFHYLPLHLSDMGQRFGGQLGDCPVTERISDQLLRLPFHNALTEADLWKVVEAVQEYQF